MVSGSGEGKWVSGEWGEREWGGDVGERGG